LIVKSISHKTAKKSAIARLVHYIYDDVKMLDTLQERKPLIVKQFLPTYNKEVWTDTLYDNFRKKTYNHKKCTVVRHEIMSFKDTHISRETLQILSRYYLKNRFEKPVRGFGVVHYSESPHVHFLFLGAAIDYSSTRIDRKSFREFKIKLQHYQMKHFPELKSIVDHRSKRGLHLKLSQKEQHMKKNRSVVSKKELLSEKVKAIASSCKSLNELTEKLEAASIVPYYRYKKLAGILMGNQKFRLTTLGVGKEHLKNLTLEQERLNALKKIVKRKSRTRGLER